MIIDKFMCQKNVYIQMNRIMNINELGICDNLKKLTQR